MNMKRLNIFALQLVIGLVIGIFINSCSTPSANTKSCLSPQLSDLKIKWGDYIMKKDVLVFGYVVHSNGDIHKLNKIQDTIGVKIGNINDEDYCDLQRRIRDEFLKVEILNVTADTMRFVEYKSLKSGSTQRAFWNSKFRTETNGGFFDIFESLQKSLK